MRRIGTLKLSRLQRVRDRSSSQRTAASLVAARVTSPASERLTVLQLIRSPGSGENISLATLLTKAIDRATSEVRTRAADPNAPTHGLDDDTFAAICRAVGIGAVKYADLSSDLVRDYVFNLDRMIAFEGNTGPYMQYAHARVCSIFARAGLDVDDPLGTGDAYRIGEPSEKTLALALLRYPGVVGSVAESLEPHRLCTYLFEGIEKVKHHRGIKYDSTIHGRFLA